VNLQKNRLAGSLPLIDLPNIEVLSLADNQLTDVRSLSRMRYDNLRTLYLSHNSLNELPVLDCPVLEMYFFIYNKLTSLEAIAKSRIPKIRKLKGIGNSIADSLPMLTLVQLDKLLLESNNISNINELARC
jgi:Leucine-rich repeat (LRR) protein